MGNNMTNLSEEQEALKNSITKSALIWGLVLGVIAGAITFWLTGEMASSERAQTTGFVAGGVGFVLFLFNSWRGKKSSKCAKCSATFSISRTGREETLVSSEEKSEHEKLEGGGSKLSEWMEDKLDVVETYNCSSCDDETTKEYQITRKRDEVVREKGARTGKGDDVEVAAVVEPPKVRRVKNKRKTK